MTFEQSLRGGEGVNHTVRGRTFLIIGRVCAKALSGTPGICEALLSDAKGRKREVITDFPIVLAENRQEGTRYKTIYVI